MAHPNKKLEAKKNGGEEDEVIRAMSIKKQPFPVPSFTLYKWPCLFSSFLG